MRDAEGTHRLHRDGRWMSREGRRVDRERRSERAARAERLWPRARRSAWALARMPFVRGVLVTGSMSKGSAGDDGDIDFLLVVAPGRVWTVKSALHVARRALPSWAREAMCTNYILAEDNLAIPEQTMFTAVELATAVPMAGPEACTALLDANPWAQRFVPGLAWSRDRAALAERGEASRGRALVERAVPGGLEPSARARMEQFWRWRYGWLPDAERRKRFKQDAGAATNHLHDHSAWVASEWAARCDAHDVPLP